MDGDRQALDHARSYEGTRPDVLDMVPRDASRVLELGCSAGAFGVSLKERQPASIVGVELDADYARVAGERLDRVVQGDVETFAAGARPAEAPFDCVICADVLEHLVDPWAVVRGVVGWMQPGGTVIVSLPNVLWYRNWLQLLYLRRWPRRQSGIFDGTHLRWFALEDAKELLTQAGLVVEDVDFRYWHLMGLRLRLAQALSRTPLATFVAAQHIVRARLPT